jgi:tRNA-intron endonuclease
MDGQLHGDAVRVGGDARQRYHDSRGYGRPLDGNEIELSRVEAAHLLFRGDLDSVDGLGFREFFVESTRERERFGLRFLVYADLRGRGFYLSPAREGWPGSMDSTDSAKPVDSTDTAVTHDFVVYPRGKGPRDGAIEYRVRVIGERRAVGADELVAAASADESGFVLAVVDEESELTYFDASLAAASFDGGTDFEPSGSVEGTLLSDRVLCWDAPDDLYERGFYGQPLDGRDAKVDGGLQLSLVEAAALAADGTLVLGTDDDYETIVERGREVEGERFDRRLRVYATLRSRGVVPKTGYKFGADFRTYDAVKSVDDLGHSEHLIRVLRPDHVFAPRDLSLDVRLAGGVRKRMVFALTDADGTIEWLSVARLKP